MDYMWDNIVRTYKFLFDDLSHPLSKDMWLVSGPFPILSILLTYNLFCTRIGPMLMKNRPPYNLKMTMKLYNIYQIIINFYIAYRGYLYIFSGKFNFFCQGVIEEDDYIVATVYLYFITRVIDLMDTIFFVLRKSDRQVTFLHLFHHNVMPLLSWLGLKYSPGGQGIFFGTANSAIHVFMYLYYLISSLGPQYKKYVQWKKYLTLMQIVQFVVIFVHSLNSLFHPCSFGVIFKLLTVLFSGTFFCLFTKFYYVNYIIRKDVYSTTREKNQHETGSKTTRKYDKSNGSHTSDRRAAPDDEYSINRNTNGKYDTKDVDNKVITNGKLRQGNRKNGNMFPNK